MLLIMNGSIIQSSKRLQSQSQLELSLWGFKLISFMQSVSAGLIFSVSPINGINRHLSLVCLGFLKTHYPKTFCTQEGKIVLLPRAPNEEGHR